MKQLLVLSLLITPLHIWAQASGGPTGKGSGPHAPTQGGNRTELLDEDEKQEAQERAKSMGGAPNAGGGMGTGTGAGSRVGPETGEGTLNAGAMGGTEEEMYESAPEDWQREEENLQRNTDIRDEDAGPRGEKAKQAVEQGNLKDSPRQQRQKQEGY